MKIIDEKGRLFGLINVFDLFILIMLGAVIIFTVRWIKIAEDPSWVKVKTLHTHCTAVMEIPSYIADLVKEGDATLDENGLSVVKIKKIISDGPSPAALYISGNGEKIFFDPQVRRIVVKLDLLAYEKNGDFYGYGGNLIRVGAVFNIVTKKYTAQAKVLEIG